MTSSDDVANNAPLPSSNSVGVKRPLIETSTAKTEAATKNTTTTGREPPRLPEIPGELLLQVCTHKSLRKNTGTTEETFRDNERLAVLGKAVLELAIISVLFDQKPRPDAEEIEIEQGQLAREIEWAQLYGMAEDLRCHPDCRASLQPEETAQTMFRAYAGAVFAHSGFEVAQDWIHQLLTGLSANIIPPDDLASSPHPHKKFKAGGLSLQPEEPPVFFAVQPQSDPSHNVAPRLDGVPNPLAPAQPGLPFLSSFHQAAARRGVSVTYSAEISGPGHASQWTMQCLVNGILKGVGTGGHKQAAKEEAARQAYYAMGWT